MWPSAVSTTRLYSASSSSSSSFSVTSTTTSGGGEREEDLHNEEKAASAAAAAAVAATPIRSPSSSTTTTTSSSSSGDHSLLSEAAQWHRQRRREMLQLYGDQIRPLERTASSQSIAVPLLLLANMTLLGLSIVCGLQNLSVGQTFLLSLFPGSILSLWQLQILHDALHGSLFEKSATRIQLFGGNNNNNNNKNNRRGWSWPIFFSKAELQKATLFWGSLPCAFGYYLYLQFGHLSHHSNVGNAQQASLEQLFASDQVEFEDGDVLFVAHRMKLLGNIGPTFTIPKLRTTTWWKKIKGWGNNNHNNFNHNNNSDHDHPDPHPNDDDNDDSTMKMTMSLSHSGFQSWRHGATLWNTIMFATSFLFERSMLVINDVVVSLTGRNWFFPHKPLEFHRDCTRYARVATLLRLVLCVTCGWQSLLFLYLSETLWSIPPHPASAMFVSNHGSSTMESSSTTTPTTTTTSSTTTTTTTTHCWPSSSTYAGRWYSLLTLGTNYHVEHHDFPTIPLTKLYQLHQIAPEYYPQTLANTNLWTIQNKAFSQPEFYACMNVGVGSMTHIE
jgi:fatty acid desaturase